MDQILPPEPDQPRLTEAEQAVLRELANREKGRPAPRLSRSYRRLIELSRSNDPINAILAAHLAREILSALPGALGVELTRERLEYENRIQELAEHWPPEARDAEPPARIVVDLRRLIEDHERASGRAREAPRALLSREDRARAGYVPDPSLDRWTDLAGRGAGLAHRLRNLERDLPSAEDVRRLVDEVTATLLAVIAPYFEGLGQVDRLLALEQPSDGDARTLAALLGTASQYAYFFERADGRWLQPLARMRGFLTTPPGLIEVGGGYVQAPFWPQGRFLARVAGTEAEFVAGLVRRIPATNNPRAIAIMVEIARALPPDRAAQLVPDIARRMSVPLAVEYGAVEAAALVRELGIAGFAEAGVTLLMSVVNAAIASPRDDEWHLEQALGDPLEALAAAGDTVGRRLRACFRRLVRARGVRRRYSTLWLRNVDRRPRYGADDVWFVANALYRALLAAPLPAAKTLAADLLADRERVLARVALAAIADRPDLADQSDEILLEASRWDEEGTTRHEFRRALAGLWTNASDAGRRALLEYAEQATEAEEIIGRLTAEHIDHDPADLRRRWRSRLLHKIRDQVPLTWLAHHGPLQPIEDDRTPEPTAEWLGTTSPVGEEELAELRPEEVLAKLSDWRPPSEPGLDAATSEGLGRTAAAVVLKRLPDFSSFAAEFGDLPTVLVAQVTSALERGLREGQTDHRGEAVSFMLDLAEVFLQRHDGEDMWTREVKRDLAGTLAFAANEEFLGEPERALTVLRALLEDPDPSLESEERDTDNGYDAGMLALNSVRGAATTAVIELLLEARRAGWTTVLDGASESLRRVASADSARSVRAAFGLRLPWLLARDVARQGEWLELLFGDTVPDPARRTTWQGYLLYSRFFPDTAALLAAQYQQAVMALEPRPQDERGRPRDEDEQLGIHVAMAHLLTMPPAVEGGWLHEFYERAAGWLRGRVTRWIAEQAASDEAGDEIRARARVFLAERVAAADSAADAEELKAVSWIAAASDHERDVLVGIVLPALEKTGGETENEPGAAALAARRSTTDPRSAARVIQLLVAGDPWRSLPHVAAAELRQALDQLRQGSDRDARAIAEDVINTLGAQGFLEFRDLLDDEDEERP
jgi:hypothetical protein